MGKKVARFSRKLGKENKLSNNIETWCHVLLHCFNLSDERLAELHNPIYHKIPFLPPENVKKPLVFWRFQRMERWNIGLKRVKKYWCCYTMKKWCYFNSCFTFWWYFFAINSNVVVMSCFCDFIGSRNIKIPSISGDLFFSRRSLVFFNLVSDPFS